MDGLSQRAASASQAYHPGGYDGGYDEGGSVDKVATGGYPVMGEGEVAIGPDGLPMDQSQTQDGVHSVPYLRRMQKGIEQNVQTVENRIKFFRREEEKIWRDLEEVRRQAAKIEEGRTRALEKRLADKAIVQVKEQTLVENKVRANKQRQEQSILKKQSALQTVKVKQSAGEQQRRESQEILRRKRLEEAQQRLNKSERVVAIQREQLEAKLRSNQERTENLARIRETQEVARIEAERDVDEVENRLPELEAQEMECLQRLQNSRIVRQTVLQELEASLGTASAVTSMLRTKQNRSSALLDPHAEMQQSTDSIPDSHDQ